MTRRFFISLGSIVVLAGVSIVTSAAENSSRTLRIICFGAHPDDCEIKAGGAAALWSKKGHKVKFVSVTNGDIGHWREAGGPLAKRRRSEVDAAAKILGIETEVLDNHDGELMPTLENRKLITKLIREWNADIVISPRPNDYHPDHRYTGILVQDAAYMVTVPFFCPDIPHLKNNPLFLYYSDGFKKPNPFKADIVISIDSVIDQKLDALGVLVSQFAEGGANGSADLLPADPQKQPERHAQVRQNFAHWFQSQANESRKELAEWYDSDQAGKIKHAEAFEICEYGRRPEKNELKKLFPFFN